MAFNVLRINILVFPAFNVLEVLKSIRTRRTGNSLMVKCSTTLPEDVISNTNEYVIFTWAKCGAGHSLEGWAFTEGSSIQRGRIGAAACSSLPAPPTASITL